MADYDSGEVTDRERQAAENQRALADYNKNTLEDIAGYNNATTNNLAKYNKEVAQSIANFNKANANLLSGYNKNNALTLRKYNSDTAEKTADYANQTQNALAKYNRNTAGTLADYSSEMQRKIASNNVANTTQIAKSNANAVKDQVQRQLQNYDVANRQNASLRDVQLKQASRKSETERFEAQRQLVNAALGLFGSMNQAMNGSTIGNAMKMLENRNDSDNTNYWQQLADNRNAVLNAYDESYNQNQVAKLDALTNARKAIRDIQSDLSANLNNIQGNLSSSLGTIRNDLLSNLSAVESDRYAALRNAESDRYTSRRNANSDWFSNYGNIEGDRFSNYNNAEAELYSTWSNEEAERLKNLNQVWGDRYTGLRNLEGDLAANLNNINPNLYEAPGNIGGESRPAGGGDWASGEWGGSIQSGAIPEASYPNGGTRLTWVNDNIPAEQLNRNITLPNGFTIPEALRTIAEIENNSIYRSPDQNAALNVIYKLLDDTLNGIKPNTSRLDDYIMPANAEQDVRGYRNRVGGNSYYSSLINGFNGR